MLKSIKARGLRQLGRVDVTLGDRSLVVIGPNGSGKSTLLEELAKELSAELSGREHPVRKIERSGGNDRDLRIAYLGRPVEATWEEDPADAFLSGRMIALAMDAERSGSPSGKPFDSEPKPPSARVGDQLEGLLVERWAQKQASTDPMRAQVFDAWFFEIRQTLCQILGEPKLRLAIQPDRCAVDLGDGRRPRFEELSLGQRAAVSLWAEVFIRVEAARAKLKNPSLDPSGVVVVDQLELHLDPRLQRELLPLLARRFPGVQWIVSTHSPLVTLSHDEAVVYDAGRDEKHSTKDVRKAGLEHLVASMIGMAPRPRSSRPPPPKMPPVAKMPPAASVPRMSRPTRSGPGPGPEKKR